MPRKRAVDSEGRIECYKCHAWKSPQSFRVVTIKRDEKEWKHPNGHCRECVAIRARAARPLYKERYRARAAVKTRAYRQAIRRECLTAYGGQCSCCGESRFEFLTLDHINGRESRKRKKQVHVEMVQLKRQGWPKLNIQLLCFNCNCAKGVYGSCPHTWLPGETKEPLNVENRRKKYAELVKK